MTKYIIIKQENNSKTTIGLYESEQQAIVQLKQIANQFNCPQKIIWENKLFFKLLSNDGTTKKYYAEKMQLCF